MLTFFRLAIWRWVLLLVISLAPWSAVAAPNQRPSQPLSASLTGDAKAAYEAGRLLFSDGDFAGAVRKFELAHKVSGDPRLLWNMAVCEKNLRHYTRVRTLVEQYLAEGDKVLTFADKKEARALLEAVTEFISPVTVEVDLPGATVYVGDREAGVTPLSEPLDLDIGTHRVRVEKQGYRTQVRELTLSGRSPETVTFRMERQAARLVLVAEDAEIRLNGKVLGKDRVDRTLSPGRHTLRVSASGKKAREMELVLADGETRRMTIELESDTNLWLWAGIIGGAAIATGTGIYFLTRPEAEPAPTTEGTISTVRLPLLGN
jgi:hypothetical protein